MQDSHYTCNAQLTAQITIFKRIPSRSRLLTFYLEYGGVTTAVANTRLTSVKEKINDNIMVA